MNRLVFGLLFLLCCATTVFAQPPLPRQTYSAPYGTRQFYPDLIGSLTHYCLTASATPNAFTCTVDHGQGLTLALVPGQLYVVTFASANTGASTLTINGLGSYLLKKYSLTGLVDLALGDIFTGDVLLVVWDGTFFQVVGSGVDGGGGSSPGLCAFDVTYASLPAALTALGTTTPATLCMTAPSVTVTAALTIPSNIHLLFLQNGVINIGSGGAVTVCGKVTSSGRQAWALSGTATLVYGSLTDLTCRPVLDHNSPELFGAKGNATADDTIPLQQWFLAQYKIATGSRAQALEFLPYRSYLISNELLFAPPGLSHTVTFDGHHSTLLIATSFPAGARAVGTMDISATARTITRSAGSFLADGFVVGRTATLRDMPNSLNNNRYPIAALTDTIMTLGGTHLVVNATAVTTRIEDNRVALQFGNSQSAPRSKSFDAVVQNLFVRSEGATAHPVVTAIKLECGDFARLTRLNIAANVEIGLHVSGLTEGGICGTNSLSMYDINASVGFAPYAEAVRLQSNNLFWEGGKLQQSTTGLVIDGAAMFAIHTLDLSLAVAPVIVQNAFAGILNLYFESGGTGVVSNNDSLILCKNSIKVSVGAANYLNAINGGTQQNKNVAYGVKLIGCTGWTIDGVAQFPQIAVVDVDETSGVNFIAPTFRMEASIGSQAQHTVTPLKDRSGKLVNYAKAQALTYLPDTKVSIVNTDITTWTPSNSAAFDGTVPGDDGVGTAVKIHFPDTVGAPSTLKAVSAVTVGAPGSSIYCHLRARLLALTAPVLTNVAIMNFEIYQPAQPTHPYHFELFRIGDNWAWYEFVFKNPPDDAAYTVLLNVQPGFEPIDIAVQNIACYVVNPYTY